MATIHGTIRGVQLIQENFGGIAARKAALLTIDFGVYVATTDSGDVASVGATIAAHKRNGKTCTTVAAVCSAAGENSAGTAVYIGAATKSTDTFTFNLTDVSGSEIDVPGGTTAPVCLLVTYDES